MKVSIDDKIKVLGLPDLCNIHDDVMVRNYDFDFDKLLYEKLHTRFCKFTMVNIAVKFYTCRAELYMYRKIPIMYKNVKYLYTTFAQIRKSD